MVDVVKTPKFRTSFVNVFQPRAANENAKPKYSLAMLFPEDADLSALKKAAQAAAKEKWGDKIPKNLKSPFLDAGDYEYDGYEPGMTLVRATSIQKPGVVDQKVEPIIEESEFYSGCYARATVRAFAYDNSGNRGVSFGLQNVQKLGDGDPLGGRTRPEDDFEAAGDVDTDSEGGADAVFG